MDGDLSLAVKIHEHEFDDISGQVPTNIVHTTAIGVDWASGYGWVAHVAPAPTLPVGPVNGMSISSPS